MSNDKAGVDEKGREIEYSASYRLFCKSNISSILYCIVLY